VIIHDIVVMKLGVIVLKQNSNFSERLKKYMVDHDMTYEILSKITGVPAQTLNRYVLSQRSPKVDAAAAIAIKLNVDPLWLQGLDASLPPNAIPAVNSALHDKPNPLETDEKELIKCYKECSSEDREELLMLARYKALKNAIAAAEMEA